MTLPFRPDLSRRSFLAAPAVIAVGAALDRLAPTAALARAPTPSENAWRGLVAMLEGPLLRPGDASYLRIAMPDNRRYAQRLPAAIARCASSRDVAAAIRWSRDTGVPVYARSGGHSYAGFSTGPGLMIETSLMNAARFDPATGRVRIGGGVRNQGVYDTLRPFGRAITHGRCPSVGAAGFLLGGGVGFNMRAHGIACDHLTASEIVTADGEILRLSEAQNADLFWACRGGGGGNFGINTMFEMETFAAEPMTVFNIVWSSARRVEDTFRALMAAVDASPERLGCRISLGAVSSAQRARGRDVSIDILGQWRGSAAELREVLAPAYAVAVPSDQRIHEMGYWAGQDFLKEAEGPLYYQERSTFLKTGVLGDAALATAFRWLREWPGTGGDADLRFFQTGGRINAQPSDHNAFVHRDSRWIMVVGLTWTITDTPERLADNHRWQDGFYSAIRTPATAGAYQNFVDPDLADWAEAYYGANLDRLRRIKAAVDPNRVFDFPQAIAPA